MDHAPDRSLILAAGYLVATRMLKVFSGIFGAQLLQFRWPRCFALPHITPNMHGGDCDDLLGLRVFHELDFVLKQHIRVGAEAP